MSRQITLTDIYQVVNRLEDKMDKRLSDDEDRIEKLENGQSRIYGFAGGISAVIGLVSGIITNRLSK